MANGIEEALQSARAALSAAAVSPAEREACAGVLREIDASVVRLKETAAGAPPKRKDLLSVICHDLKDPLASIVMGAGFLKKTLPQDDALAAARRVVDAIQRSAERMNGVIGDFYDIGKMESGQIALERRPHEAAALVRAAYDQFLPRAKDKSLVLDHAIADGIGEINVDRARVLQVFTKLLGNALKYTPEKGQVTVGLEPGSGAARFFVKDTGKGVPEARRESVFDREANQRQTPRDGPGLGLAIAKGLVLLHGGAIGHEHAPPQGSKFWFTIPTA